MCCSLFCHFCESVLEVFWDGRFFYVDIMLEVFDRLGRFSPCTGVCLFWCDLKFFLSCECRGFLIGLRSREGTRTSSVMVSNLREEPGRVFV